MGTIHKLCVDLLRQHYDINSIIIDDDISKEYILKVLLKLKIDEKHLTQLCHWLGSIL